MAFLFILSTDAKSSSPRYKYSDERIQDLKLGSQAWTFRKFSFYEMLDMMQDLDLHYLEAYPGQVLEKNKPGIKFGHDLTNKHINKIKKVLKDHNITLVNYGVVGFDNNENSTDP